MPKIGTKHNARVLGTVTLSPASKSGLTAERKSCLRYSKRFDHLPFIPTFKPLADDGRVAADITERLSGRQRLGRCRRSY